MQVKSQIANDPTLMSEFQKDPEATIRKISSNIDMLQVAVSAGIGSTGIKTTENLSNLKNNINARQTIQKQLENAQSTTKIDKLTTRLDEKTNEVINSFIVLLTPFVVKEAMTKELDKK